MEHNFYRFTNMHHVIQPENSYWCWAACAEKMIQGLRSKSEIGNNKCQIVSYYKNNILTTFDSSVNNNDQQNSTSCCNESGEFLDECNIGLKDTHFIEIFNQIGFECEEFLETDKLKNIDFIIEQLEQNDSPIILKLNTSMAHMVLISGYGERNGCKYIFIGDPSPGYGENYVRFDIFLDEYIRNSKIAKFWTSKVKKIDANKKNIVLDLDIPDDPEEHFKAINSKIEEINSAKSNFSVNIFFKKENLEVEESSFINENYQKDFSSLLPNFCFKKFPFGIYAEINLLNNIREKINPDEEISDLYIINFNEFFTIAITRENSGVTEIKPITFPSNYKLDDTWQNYDEFYSTLQKLPKGVFFED